MTLGRTTLEESLSAIAARDYQRAGEIALRGVVTPMRLAGESLAAVIEAFAQPGIGGAAWRDRATTAIDVAVPKLLDGMQALYANVLFERLLRRRDEPMFKLDVPSPEDVAAHAADEIAKRGAEKANLDQAGVAFGAATGLLDVVVSVAETWSSCANDVEKLKEFYPLAETGAKALMDCATTLRIAVAVFRGAGALTPDR